MRWGGSRGSGGKGWEFGYSLKGELIGRVNGLNVRDRGGGGDEGWVRF